MESAASFEVAVIGGGPVVAAKTALRCTRFDRALRERRNHCQSKGGSMSLAYRTFSTLSPQKLRMLALTTAFVAAVCVPVTSAAQGKDDLWEITSKMEMPGMPMAMPAQTQRICVAKTGKDDDYIPKRENCRLQDSRRTGNKVTYKMVCTGKDALTISGETTFAATSYEGRMQMSGKMDGQQVEMNQTYSGKRVGDCTASK
jgi:hypothetical protein